MAKKTRDRKRQTTISFSPAAKSSPAATIGATPSKSAAATTPTRASRARPGKASKAPVIDSSEDDLLEETERGMKLGLPVHTQNGMFGSSDVDAASSEDELADESRRNNTKVKANLGSRKRRRGTVSSEPEEEEDEVVVVKTKRRRQHSPEVEVPEDDELRLPRSTRKKTIKRHEDEELRLPRSTRNKTNKRQCTPDDAEEDESDVVEVTPARNRRRRATKPQSDSEEETTPPVSRQRKSSNRERTSKVVEVPSPPRSTRRRLAKRPPTPSDDSEEEEEKEEEEEEDENTDAGGGDKDNSEEREDLAEDLSFLRSSPLPDRGKLRSAHDKPKNERQRALEALKKRRAGTNEPSSSATPNRCRRVVVESESDSELEVIKEEPESDQGVNEDEEEDEEEEEGSHRDANALDMFLEDEEDEAFIDNDVDAIIGEPVLGPDDFMPLILSRLSSAKPKELFKYAIEWMVMKKIHPGFDSKSQVYDITFRKLDDEVKGLANSKFSSSAWTPDFTRALRARPNLMISELTRGRKEVMDAHCEACNRRNHPASDELMFTGLPYNKETLEPLDTNTSDSDKDDSDSDSELSADSEADLNGEKPTYDASGARLPPENKTFTLGRTCKANAQVAHTLHHWRYHLYSWVRDYLAREKHLTAEKLVQRDGWSDKKREKAALKIVKGMEEVGEIGKLYRLYKDQMTYAAEVRHDLQRGWRGGD